VEGSTLYVRLVALAGIELYIDGEFVDSENYWFDGLHILSERARGGESHTLVLRSPKSDSRGHFNFAEWYLGEIEELLLDIGIVESRHSVLQALAGELPGVSKNGLPEKLEVAEESSLADLHARMMGFDKDLVPAARGLEELTTYLVGHAHIDMNWLWDWEDTVETIRRTFTSVEGLLEEFPELVFSQSQAAVYKIMQDHYPEIFEDIRKRVRQGRWDVTASTWVEGDLNMASGESLVRQTTCALRYIENNFGVTPRVAWCPDTFGHPWTYPQVLRKCGIEFYYAHRCTRPGFEHLFWWESPEGSRVLVFNEGVTYNNKIAPELSKSLPKMVKNYGIKSHLVVFGVGDHGGGPTRMDLLNGRRISREGAYPKLRYSPVEDFYSAAAKSDRIPCVSDELNFVFEGCYTTHADIKRMNRRGEAMLFETEVLASLASRLGREYPENLIESAWHSVLFNQFHDLLDGSAIKVAYEHSHEIFGEASDICSGITRVSLPTVLGLDSGEDASDHFTVFNTMGWERCEPVEVKTQPGQEYSMALELSTGRECPLQVEGDRATFMARVPGVGHSVYRLVRGNRSAELDPDSPRATEPSGDGQPYHLENRFFRITLEPGSGTISSLYDKTLEREIVGAGDTINVFQLCYEKPHGMSAWRIGPISRMENLLDGAEVEVVASGPVRASLKISRGFGRSSSLVQEITIHRNLPRIDFHTEIDWQEMGGDDLDSPMLKVAFSLSHSSATCVREIPFGHIESQTDGREVPSLTFLELPGDGFGVSLLNDCKYGHDVRGNTVRLTLLRAAYDPDPAPDVGSHRLTYSLLPHRGSWTDAEVWKQGHGLNLPLRCVQGRAESEGGSRLSIDARGVDMAALKGVDGGEGLVLRLVEMHGREVPVDLDIGWEAASITRCDLLEVPVGEAERIIDGRTSILLGAHEIGTFMIE